MPDDVIPDDDDLGVGQRDKVDVDVEPGDPTGDMHEAESGYVHEDPDRPQYRVSTDLLHDIVHREQDLKKEAKKVDEPGRTAERRKHRFSFEVLLKSSDFECPGGPEQASGIEKASIFF